MTRSRISVPLTNPRSSTACPASSTPQTMIAPTFEYLFSTSRVSWVENVIPPELSAMTPAIAAAIGVVVKLMMRPPTLRQRLGLPERPPQSVVLPLTDDVVLVGPGGRGCARRNVQLAEDIADMSIDRLLAEEQFAGDCLV